MISLMLLLLLLLMFLHLLLLRLRLYLLVFRLMMNSVVVFLFQVEYQLVVVNHHHLPGVSILNISTPAGIDCLNASSKSLLADDAEACCVSCCL